MQKEFVNNFSPCRHAQFIYIYYSNKMQNKAKFIFKNKTK